MIGTEAFWTRAGLTLTLGLLGAGITASISEATASTSETASTRPAVWFEVVPFAADAEVARWRFGAEDAEEVWTWKGTEGQAVICNGMETGTTHCRSQYLRPGDVLHPVLAPGVVVTGKLVSEHEPVVGARVRLTLAELEARKPFLVPLAFAPDAAEPRREVRTDAEGRFELPQLGPGTYRLEIQAPGGRIDLLDAFTVPEPELLLGTAFEVEDQGAEERSVEEPASRTARLDLGEIDLARGLGVHFIVSNTGGEVLAGAQVAASQPVAGQRVEFSGATNTDGEARLTGFGPDQPLHVLCRAKGHVAERQAFESPPTDVHCYLDPLAKVRGRVQHDGEPVANAAVSFELPSRFSGASPNIVEIPVSADGRFEAENLNPSTYQLVVAAPGFRVEERTVTLAAGETKDLATIELSTASELWGRVQDAESGEPVAGAQLTSLRPPGAVQTVTDEAGEFRSAIESEQPIRVRVLASAYPPLSIELPPDPTVIKQPFVIDLEAGGWIDVLAFDDESGLPCAGCPIVHDMPGGGPGGLGRGSGTTDLDGRVRFGPLTVGRHHVILEQVRSEGSTVTVTSGGDVQLADVRAGETTQVIFGSPSRDIRVRIWPPPAGWQLSSQDGASVLAAPVDADNTFTVHHRGREVDLRLSRPGTSIYLGRIPADFQDASLDFELPTASLQGVLEGSAHEVRLVSAHNARRTAWTVTDASGAFEVPFLAAGVYHLEVDGEIVQTVSLTDGERLNLEALGVER